MYNDLITPQFALPSQLTHLRERPATGERRLLCAILQSALHDIERYRDCYGERAATIVDNARTWIASDDGWPTFSACCDAAGLDADAVRAAVLG